MEPPKDTNRPFFAYGIFKPGQIAFFQLQEFVCKAQGPAELKGTMLLRDGLPLLDQEGDQKVCGILLTFTPDKTVEAYQCIGNMEPENQYYWNKEEDGGKIFTIGGKPVNVLIGRSPKKGSVILEEREWNGWKDPLFTQGLEVVEETLEKVNRENKCGQECISPNNLRPLFRLQMAYLLLWSSLERYASLRYGLKKSMNCKLERLSQEPAFRENLNNYVKKPLYVFRSDNPAEKKRLNPEDPEGSIFYYYQIRCNSTHRGKGVFDDFKKVREALSQLLPLYYGMLKAAEQDAKYPVDQILIKH